MRLMMIAAVTALALPFTVSAQSLPKMKPGAWEITTTHEGGNMQGMNDMLAKMPPQVREMMQKNMPQQQGPQSSAIRHCATPNDESFARDLQASVGMNLKCENSNIRQSAGIYQWTSKCSGQMMAGQPFRSESEHVVTFTGGDAFTHKSTSRSEGGMMGSGPTTSSTSGRFLGADCKANNALTMEERMKSVGGMMPRGQPR